MRGLPRNLIQELRRDSGEGRDGGIGAGEVFEEVGRGDSEDFHSGAAGGLDSDVCVLDHETVCGGKPESLGGEQEDIRGGFAVPDIVRGDDRIEKFAEAGGGENGIQVRAGS